MANPDEPRQQQQQQQPAIEVLQPIVLPPAAPGAGWGPAHTTVDNALGGDMCKDYLRGKCTRPSCRFSHGDGSIMQIFAGNGSGSYAGGGGAGGELCRDFTNGKCARGERCRYSHTLGAVGYGTAMAGSGGYGGGYGGGGYAIGGVCPPAYGGHGGYGATYDP